MKKREKKSKLCQRSLSNPRERAANTISLDPRASETYKIRRTSFVPLSIPRLAYFGPSSHPTSYSVECRGFYIKTHTSTCIGLSSAVCSDITPIHHTRRLYIPIACCCCCCSPWCTTQSRCRVTRERVPAALASSRSCERTQKLASL